MQWIALVVTCAVLSAANAGPDPKKYKLEVTDKEKKSESTLTDKERKFLREVEAKFGVKSELPSESKQEVETKIEPSNSTSQPLFPAVIAIEIINDTDSKSKDKRTVDANLGYGYRTNKGYTYNYFGKPIQEKGKFMIYPYSQEDITPGYHNQNNGYLPQTSGRNPATRVEIQPSQAFELVSVKANEDSYNENFKPSDSSPSTYTQDTYKTQHPSTLYTTYNGESLSGLSGQFPSLMSNYFVDPTQLLKNPHYQEVGLTQDHLNTNGAKLKQPVVPVLVLRIPSSYLKNPTAELYANLPNNYPLSHYLNNINLQELVNQYFKKHGYPFAPQLMTSQNSLHTSSDVVSDVPNYERQQYSNPYGQPSYTQADFSGVQYSAVKPVMAKYPFSYIDSSQKYSSPHFQTTYQSQVHQEPYQYVPQSETETYHEPSHYQNQYQTSVESHEQQNEHIGTTKQQIGLNDGSSSTDYGTSQYSPNHETKAITVTYDNNTPLQVSPQIKESYNSAGGKYDEQIQYHTQQVSSLEDSKQTVPEHSTSQPPNEYYSSRLNNQKGSLTIFPSQIIHEEQTYETYREPSASHQGYEYPKPRDNLASNIFEAPRKYINQDHTIATVLPYTQKKLQKPNTETVQTVSYVTPMPYSAKYQSRYRVMVPQTILKSNTDEKVSYVNSQSVPMHYTQMAYQRQEHSAEDEYGLSSQYIPTVGKQRPASYPRNHHSYPKRMTRPENKFEASAMRSSLPKKQNEQAKSS